MPPAVPPPAPRVHPARGLRRPPHARRPVRSPTQQSARLQSPHSPSPSCRPAKGRPSAAVADAARQPVRAADRGAPYRPSPLHSRRHKTERRQQPWLESRQRLYKNPSGAVVRLLPDPPAAEPAGRGQAPKGEPPPSLANGLQSVWAAPAGQTRPTRHTQAPLPPGHTRPAAPLQAGSSRQARSVSHGAPRRAEPPAPSPQRSAARRRYRQRRPRPQEQRR